MYKRNNSNYSIVSVIKRPQLSIVVPVYNEKQVLPIFQKRLSHALKSLELGYEIIFVDDGSSDGSNDILTAMARSDFHIKVILLSRNFGKEAALTAGLSEAQGQATIVIDADLQDPPELIPEMVDAWRRGVDVVCMKRRSREGESRLKRASAHLFYRLLNRLSRHEIPEDTGDFRLLSRSALDAVNSLPERNRYMKGLFAWVGFSTLVLEYDRAPRAAGKTKWQYSALLGLAIDAITSFSIAPLRCMTGVGAVAATVGLIFGFWIVVKTLVLGNPVAGYPSLIALITFLGGMQLLSIGIIGEYIGKIYSEVKKRPIFLIKKILSQTVGNSQVSYTARTDIEPESLAKTN